MSASARAIENLLPQTQCRQCGYAGCAPYAVAVAEGRAALNLCTPGGETVIRELAALTGRPLLPPADPAKAAAPKAIARIIEDACIGCTACIKACPVDAILGATRHMHSVISDECTGCELCLPPCPVDCIELEPVADAWLPRAGVAAAPPHEARRAAAQYALQRYRRRTRRLHEQAEAKVAHLAHKRAAAHATAAAATAPPASGGKLNPAALIAQAMARAQMQQTQRSSAANRDDFQQQQRQREQQRAALRRAQRDLQYGDEAAKAAALAWLRAHKAAED